MMYEQHSDETLKATLGKCSLSNCVSCKYVSIELKRREYHRNLESNNAEHNTYVVPGMLISYIYGCPAKSHMPCADCAKLMNLLVKDTKHTLVEVSSALALTENRETTAADYRNWLEKYGCTEPGCLLCWEIANLLEVAQKFPKRIAANTIKAGDRIEWKVEGELKPGVYNVSPSGRIIVNPTMQQLRGEDHVVNEGGAKRLSDVLEALEKSTNLKPVIKEFYQKYVTDPQKELNTRLAGDMRALTKKKGQSETMSIENAEWEKESFKEGALNFTQIAGKLMDLFQEHGDRFESARTYAVEADGELHRIIDVQYNPEHNIVEFVWGYGTSGYDRAVETRLREKRLGTD